MPVTIVHITSQIIDLRDREREKEKRLDSYYLLFLESIKHNLTLFYLHYALDLVRKNMHKLYKLLTWKSIMNNKKTSIIS